MSRARITQIMDLLMLAPEIQDEVVCGSVDITLKDLLRICAAAAWEEQRRRWQRMRRPLRVDLSSQLWKRACKSLTPQSRPPATGQSA